jgi:hypothetical protein
MFTRRRLQLGLGESGGWGTGRGAALLAGVLARSGTRTGLKAGAACCMDENKDIKKTIGTN